MSNSVTTSKRRLGDCLSFIVDNRGKTPPLSEHGIELIEINAIPGNRKSVDFDAVKKHVSQDTYNTWFRKGHPQVGDTLISTVGAIGRVAFVGKQRGCIAQNVIAMRPDVNLVDPGYLFYVLSSDAIQNRLNSLNIGVAQPSLKVPHLLNVELEFPDLPTQRKIADILSAYDDLIENNLRRIKILEEMAQSLYREWFVHFRFPGHESARFTDSDIGRIPIGWDVKVMTEAVIVRPKVSIPKGGNIPFVTMGGLSENSMLIIEVESRDAPTGARFQNGDTLFARITPCLENGKTGYVEFLPSGESAACGSTEFIVLRSKTVCPQYVYLMARSDAFRDNAIKSMSGATGRQRVRDECFDQFFLAQPPPDLLVRFDSITRTQFELIHALNRRNQKLRRTRDLLLPKLLENSN
jgi:type I restriction enzyme S subunit